MPPSSASFRALIWMVVPGGGDSYSDAVAAAAEKSGRGSINAQLMGTAGKTRASSPPLSQRVPGPSRMLLGERDNREEDESARLHSKNATAMHFSPSYSSWGSRDHHLTNPAHALAVHPLQQHSRRRNLAMEGAGRWQPTCLGWLTCLHQLL